MTVDDRPTGGEVGAPGTDHRALDGVAGDPSLELEDVMHPNAKGVEKIVKAILPTVEKAIAALPGQS